MWLKAVGAVLFALGFFAGVITALMPDANSWPWWGVFVVGLGMFVAARFQDGARY